MKKLFATLMALIGTSASTGAETGPQTMDPKSILFSIPTLSDGVAPVEPVATTPKATDFAFHEDDWAQVEFFPRSKVAEIQRLLREYKRFESANRIQYGWKDVYVRKISRVPVISGQHSVRHLESILGVKAAEAPILFYSNTITGKVKNGFSIPLGGTVTLYGYQSPEGIPVLGALVGQNPDNQKLVDAFSKLNKSDGLVLVDWRQQVLLLSVDLSGQLQAWSP